jgi:hypothetical protein
VRKILCEHCFFYDFTELVCAKGQKVPQKNEECHFFTPHVAIDFSFEEVDNTVEGAVDKNGKKRAYQKQKTK